MLVYRVFELKNEGDVVERLSVLLEVSVTHWFAVLFRSIDPMRVFRKLAVNILPQIHSAADCLYTSLGFVLEVDGY